MFFLSLMKGSSSSCWDEEMRWYDVRDTLLGDNYKRQNVAAALSLARKCAHPHAVQLCRILQIEEEEEEEEGKEGKEEKEEEKAEKRELELEREMSVAAVRARLSEEGGDFAQSLAALLSGERAEAQLRVLAHRGEPSAQVRPFQQKITEEGGGGGGGTCCFCLILDICLFYIFIDVTLYRPGCRCCPHTKTKNSASHRLLQTQVA